jgi:hypothetical protein
MESLLQEIRPRDLSIFAAAATLPHPSTKPPAISVV